MLGLVLLSLVLIFTDNRFNYLVKVRYYASYVIAPLHWLADAPATASESVSVVFETRQALVNENKRLKEQLFSQKYQLQKLAHLSAENARLNQLQNASAIVSERLVRVQLTAESSNSFSKKILINLGQRSNVNVGQPVLDAFGLFGQVIEVEPFHSRVQLITDPGHATPVQIVRNGTRAIASGTQDRLHLLVLDNISDTVDIIVGDELVTSGLGQRYPAGYPVGVVSRIVHDPGQPFAKVTVEPTAQFDRSRNLLLVY